MSFWHFFKYFIIAFVIAFFSFQMAQIIFQIVILTIDRCRHHRGMKQQEKWKRWSEDES